MSCFARKALAASLVALISWGALLAEDAPPRKSTHREEVETRLVQVDVSVLPPGNKSYASMLGLSMEHFDIRLDGKKLTEEQLARVSVDPICGLLEGGTTNKDTAAQTAPTLRLVLVIVDFNYIDARGRHIVARTLDELAEHAKQSGAIYKIYGLTRQVRQLTNGFTNDPEKIRRAAQLIRASVHRGALVRDGESDIPATERESIHSVSTAAPFQPLPAAAAAQAEIAFSDIWGDARSNYNPTASIAGIEAILRAHSHRRGRKAVLLFSSEAFRFSREEKRELETRGIEALGQKGFTIWTIDVEGVGRERSGTSELLSMLAQNSGGDSLRKTGHLMRAFEHAEEQLSCYYLISLPVSASVSRTTRHDLLVKLDTDRFPKLWGYRVLAPTRITLANEATRLHERRIAALFSPEDYTTPRVSATIGYPKPWRDRFLLPVRLRVPLKELEWVPRDGKLIARVLIDAVVERDTGRGRESVCQTNTDALGVLELSLPKPLHKRSHAGLAIILPCLMKKDGLLTARGVVTDLETGRSGAGRTSVIVRRDGLEKWTALSPAVRAASGQDLVWNQQMSAARKDRLRKAWREISATAPASVVDRIALEYVLCGPERRGAQQELRHVLIRIVKGEAKICEIIPPKDLELAQGETEGPFCSGARVTLPEFSMEAGHYAFVILREKSDPSLALSTLAQEDPSAGVLGVVRFTVTP